MKVELLLIICTIAWGCGHSLDYESEDITKEVNFMISSSSYTRSGKEIFAVGDSIGIYTVKRVDDEVVAIPSKTGNQVHNVKWVKTKDGWRPASPSDKVIWSSDNTPLDFYAYYPYSREASDPTAINLAVKREQVMESDIRESDVLWATNVRGLKEGDVELQFKHLFSLIEVKLESDNILSMSSVKVMANEVTTNVSFNLGTGEQIPLVTGKVTLCDIDPEQMLYQAVLPSQRLQEGLSFLHCEWDESIYIYHSPEIELEPACLQKFEIKLK